MTRTDSTRTAVVDDAHEWRRMSECPPHRKCLLRNAGGMPTHGMAQLIEDMMPRVLAVGTIERGPYVPPGDWILPWVRNELALWFRRPILRPAQVPAAESASPART